MKEQTLLRKARDHAANAADRAKGERPCFHFTPQTGWMNDPNGLCVYRGEYHLFYQSNPYRTTWGTIHWGHAVSTDLLTWRHLPIAIAPDTEADKGGCFSGGAVPLPDGRLLLMYTGVSGTNPPEQTQCIAVGDGVDFEKLAHNPVIGAAQLPEGYSTADFRDPKVWLEGGELMCAVACKNGSGRGEILLFSGSLEGEWTYRSTLCANPGDLGSMWECPDFFSLDGWQALLINPQEMRATADMQFHPGNNTVMMLGEYDAAAHRFEPKKRCVVDYGLDYYAPQTLKTPDGRRVMIGWMANWDTVDGAHAASHWYGHMGLPREISVRDGRLIQSPVRELEAYWAGETAVRRTVCSETVSFDGVCGRLADVSVRVREREAGGLKRFDVQIAKGGGLCTQIICSFEEGTLTLDRSLSGSARDILHRRTIRLDTARGEIDLRIVLDKECVEVFACGGEAVLSMLIDTPLSAQDMAFRAYGTAETEIVCRQLKR